MPSEILTFWIGKGFEFVHVPSSTEIVAGTLGGLWPVRERYDIPLVLKNTAVNGEKIDP